MAPKLTYFDFAGSRGEECRLAFHIAGVPFEDERVSFQDWGPLRADSPWQNLPYLTVDGRIVGQSNAILSWIGRTHDLLPTDSWQLAVHDSLMAACEELRHQVGPTLRIKDEAEKKAARAALAADYLPRWGANVERLLGDGPFFAGDTLTIADLKLFIVARWFTSGVLDHVSTDVFSACPKLLALQDAVAAHPRVLDWYASS